MITRVDRQTEMLACQRSPSLTLLQGPQNPSGRQGFWALAPAASRPPGPEKLQFEAYRACLLPVCARASRRPSRHRYLLQHAIEEQRNLSRGMRRRSVGRNHCQAPSTPMDAGLRAAQLHHSAPAEIAEAAAPLASEALAPGPELRPKLRALLACMILAMSEIS